MNKISPSKIKLGESITNEQRNEEKKHFANIHLQYWFAPCRRHLSINYSILASYWWETKLKQSQFFINSCFQLPQGNSIKWIFLRIFHLFFFLMYRLQYWPSAINSIHNQQNSIGFIFMLPSSIKYSLSDFSLFIRFDWRNEQPSYHQTDDMHSIFMRRWFFSFVCLYCFCINLKQSQKRTTP